MSASSQYYSVTARVGVPHRHEVEVTIPLVGPAGATGPAGAAGASAWNDISGKPSTFAPSAHASSHATGGSDPIAPANIGAAQAVTVIELTPSPGSTTITTSQLPARGIAYAPPGETTYTVNLPTPDIRQSGLTFSIKTEYEEGSGTVFITVVHNATTLLNTELDEDESSIDFLWDGYAWTYNSSTRLRSYPNRVLQIPFASGTLALTESADNVFRIVGSADATKKLAFEVDGLTTGTTRTLTVPNASGTIARTEDFAAPPSIGSTTANAGSFTTLNATGTTELVNGGTTAGPFRVYNTFTSATNFERLNLRWASNVAIIGTEKGSAGGSARALEFQTDGTTRLTLAANGNITIGTGTANGFYQRTTNAVTFLTNNVEVNAVGLQVSNTIDFGNGLGGLIDTTLARDAANILAMRRSNNPQAFRLYNANSGTNNVNFERANFRWASNEFIIDAEFGGTGTALRGIKIGSATSSLLGFYGVTPVDQPATVADPAGGGTVDAEARTAINAIIDRLQELGLIA